MDLGCRTVLGYIKEEPEYGTVGVKNVTVLHSSVKADKSSGYSRVPE